MTPDDDKSLGDGATFSGQVKQSRSDMSLGDERTISGGDAAGLDTVLDDIEIVDLDARYKTERSLREGGSGARDGHATWSQGGDLTDPQRVGVQRHGHLVDDLQTATFTDGGLHLFGFIGPDVVLGQNLLDSLQSFLDHNLIV